MSPVAGSPAGASGSGASGSGSPDRSGVAGLMVQGTGSGVGKTVIVAGLCRAYSRRGLRVRPFKPQNMSNNAAVVAGGGAEIGRAQTLQALACGVPPTADMNPVLLKPQGETGAQIVLGGTVHGTATARDYHALKPRLLPAVMAAFRRLQREADLILVEGAGSPAEINLRAGDIANMGFAAAADLPVLLAADIERGGVIASLVGTHSLLSATEQRRVRGFVVNKFRGDPRLFDAGATAITDRTGWPHLGTLPHLPAAAGLPAEDAADLAAPRPARPGPGRRLRIIVPHLPRIANFDDLDPLLAEPDVRLEILPLASPLPGDTDLVLLPGSKSTIADLQALRAHGWDVDIQAARRRGTGILGICGGYQMLGQEIADPDGREGPASTVPGLGLLQVRTVLGRDKTVSASHGLWDGHAVTGYRMHLGQTTGPDTARPWMRLDGAADGVAWDGARSPDGLVAGSYIHGLFASDGFRHAFLNRYIPGRRAGVRMAARIEAGLDRVADALETCLDLTALLALAREAGLPDCRSPARLID